MQDTFGRKITYLRLSVTDLCNLRCKYCMPYATGHKQMLSEEETVLAVSAAAKLGVKKLRITGGEPLLRKNIVGICARLAKVPGLEEVSMTTNGILLPQFADDLVSAGVRRINISLDSLNAEKYRHMTGVGELADAMRGIEAALRAGFSKVKINVVLIGGFNDDEIRDFAELTKKYPIDIRFIELMPMKGGERFDRSAYLSCDAVLSALSEGLIPDGGDGVAKQYRLAKGLGKIGLIRPISDHFCAECNRLRLTADGRIKPCLHNDCEIDIRGMNESQMREAFLKAASMKPEWHGPLSPCFISASGRGMNEIGG